MKKDDFRVSKNYIDLYQKVSLSGYLKILCCHKKRIKAFNEYVLEFLEKNKSADVRNSSLTIYSEKINQFYHEKRKSFWSSVFNTLVVLGTFLMVIATFLALLD